MKVRESGMPDESRWRSFFNPEVILDELGLDQNCKTAADMGCGYGIFSIPAALRVTGKIYAFDIDPDMIAACKAKAAQEGIRNMECQQRDFITNGTGLPDESVDFVMLFNILHAENPVSLLKEAHRILVSGGRVGVIHWNYDPSTPRGPSMEIRPRPEQCQDWIQIAGFQLIRPWIDLPPYHYGMVGQITKSTQNDRNRE
jgi:ubiquinone/menaquinone biosynthesis C-methylase UbiE